MGILPEGISTYSGEIDDLIVLITILTGIGFIVSELFLIGFAIKYRRKEGVKASYIKGVGWKQVQWIVYPTIMLACVDLVIDLETNKVWAKVMQELPKDGEKISVTGMQFQWKFAYPGEDGMVGTDDDKVVFNELHVPVNKNILFTLESKDVLHSFFIPNVRFKQDAIPGRVLKRWFNATKVGEYTISCAEICGTGHTNMAAKLIVHEQEDYYKWLNEKVEMPEGKLIMQKNGCLGCHTLSPSGTSTGPSLYNVLGRKEKINGGTEIVIDKEYLRKSIQQPDADIVDGYQSGLMPKLTLTDEEIDKIIEFLETVK